MTRAGGAEPLTHATPPAGKKFRIYKGHVVIEEASGGYLQTLLDYTVKSRRDNKARSFLNKLKNRRRDKQRVRKRSRLFQRLMSGIQFAQYLGQTLRVIALTSSPISDVSKMNRHCEVLRKRIERKYKKIEFCKIGTPEGQGDVIHMLYRGSYIPHSWLSEQWEDIHGAPNVFIQLLRGSGNHIANYFLGYLGHHSEFRLGYSRGWVFPGFAREWTRIKRYYLRFFYFYGWSFRQAMSAAVFYLKQLLYWIATDPFYTEKRGDFYW